MSAVLSEPVLSVIISAIISVLTFAVYQLVRLGMKLQQSTGSDALWLMSGLNIGAVVASDKLRPLVPQPALQQHVTEIFLISFFLSLALWLVTLVCFDKPMQELIYKRRAISAGRRALAFVPWLFLVILVVGDYLPFRMGR